MNKRFDRLHAIKEAVDQIDFVDGRWVIRRSALTDPAIAIIEAVAGDWGEARNERGDIILNEAVSPEDIAESIAMSDVEFVESVEDVDAATAAIIWLAKEIIDVVDADARHHLAGKLMAARKVEDPLQRIQEEFEAVIDFCRFVAPQLTAFDMRVDGDGQVAVGWIADRDEIAWRLERKMPEDGSDNDA